MEISRKNESRSKLDTSSNLIKNAINLSTVFIQYDKDLLSRVFTKEMLEVCLNSEKQTLKKNFKEYEKLIAKQQAAELSTIERIDMIGELTAYLDDIYYIYKLCETYEEAINEDSLQDDEVIARIEQTLIEANHIPREEESQDLKDSNNLKR